MRYFLNTKTLVIPIFTLERIINQAFIDGKDMSGQRIMSALLSEMCACGVISPSDKELPQINIIEVRLNIKDTINVINKRQKLIVERLEHGKRKRKRNKRR